MGTVQAQRHKYFKWNYDEEINNPDYILTLSNDTIYCQLTALQKMSTPWWQGYYEIEVLIAGKRKIVTPQDIKGYYKSADHKYWESGFYESKYLPYDKEKYRSQWFIWDKNQGEHLFMKREITGHCNYYTTWRTGRKAAIFHIFIQKQNDSLYMIKKNFLLMPTSIINLERKELASYLNVSESFKQQVLLNRDYKLKNDQDMKEMILLYNQSMQTNLSSQQGRIH